MSGINLITGRCDNCSFNADSSLFGYYMYVGNCNCDNPSPQINPNTNQEEPVGCRCDVVINNRRTRYECDQVTSISDCVDRLTYCMDSTFNNTNRMTPDLQRFCNTPTAPEENFREIGDTNYYIEDGHIIWNLQYQASRCGSARTDTRDQFGNPYVLDQAPNCYPYSKVHFSNEQVSEDDLTCYDGSQMMVSQACNNLRCEPGSLGSECCVSDSVCRNSVLGCQGFRDQGIELCSESNLEPCRNPCATIIDIPQEDPSWKADVCEFFCPSIQVQDFWFGNDNQYSDYDGPENTGRSNRICSEEYFTLCKLAGCEPDNTCKVSYWNNESGPREWGPVHPTVVRT